MKYGDAIADYTRDTLNCDYEIQFIAGSDYKDKLTVMAATGDVWDMNLIQTGRESHR